MSHFTVLVTNTQDSNVNEQLAPYDEQVEPGSEFSQFQIEIYKGKEHEYLKNEISSWLDHLARLAARCTGEETAEENERRMQGTKKRILELVEDMRLDSNGLYEKLKEYYEYSLDAQGNLGYWHNPNAQWDWYVIGGRWDKCLTCKDGTGANVCKKKDLDIDKTKSQIFAVLHEGEWHEKAKMGWWGFTTDDKAEDAWQEEIVKILDSLTDNAELTLVDCHI